MLNSSKKNVNINLFNFFQNKPVTEESKLKITVPDYNKVPLKIFQTWYTKNLPPNMKRAVESIKKHNPEFEHVLRGVNISKTPLSLTPCRILVSTVYT